MSSFTRTRGKLWGPRLILFWTDVANPGPIHTPAAAARPDAG